MTKLLALSVALLSVSLYGADKKTPNEIRLENRVVDLERFAKEFRAEAVAALAEVAKLNREIELGRSNRALLALQSKPIDSLNGLEGIAIDGLNVIVEDYSKSDKTFNAKTIGNQVKLRLLQSGIKEGKYASSSYLLVNALPIDVGGKVAGYALSIEAIRRVTFEANGKTYSTFEGTIWNVGGTAPVGGLRKDINTYMDEFLLAYLKANPKKKEKE